MDNLPVPLSRVELYLAKACGMDVTVPEAPESRIEQYLAILAGDTSIEMPAPLSLTEQWLAYILGVTPDPLLAVDGACYIDNQKVDVRYFAVAAGMPGAVLPPAPQNRKEQYFANLNVGPSGVLKYATGTNITLTDVVSGIEELQFVYGDTLQNGTPTPDIPVPIQTVAGEQTVAVGNGNKSKSYIINLGPIELCKIGDYQDYIYKSGDDWYVHKATNKLIANSSQNWSYNEGTSPSNTRFLCVVDDTALEEYTASQPALVMSNCFGGANWYNIYRGLAGNNAVSLKENAHRIIVHMSSLSTIDAWNTFITNNTVLFRYVIATPTDTKIADATLISQLNAVDSAILPKPVAYITVGSTGPNLPASLKISYYGEEE